MKTINVYAGQTRSVNDRFWAASGSDELYAMAYSPEGAFLMNRMNKFGSCRYVRNHYTLSRYDTEGIRCGGDVYSEDENGNPVYDFAWINGVYRKFVENGIKPIVELDFLPDALSGISGDITQEGTGAQLLNHFYPNNWEKWTALLKAFVRNLADEFGLEEIRTWYFEVWNEPDNWPIDSWPMFFKLYDVFVDAVTSVDAKLRVGGPGAFRQHFMYAFLDHVVNGINYVTGETGSRVDFLSFHIYGMSGEWLPEWPLVMPTVQRFTQELLWVKRMIDRYPTLEGVELMLNEWGVVSNYERCVADHPPLELRNSEYSALFMMKLVDSILELREKYDFNITMLLYWGFAGEDFFGKMFNGNRCLTTKGNICKPIQTAHELLSKLGDRLVKTDMVPGADEGTIAAADGNSVQALVYYFNECDMARAYPNREYELCFCDLDDGDYMLEVCTIDDTHNNTFRLWQRLGCPENPTDEQLALIHAEQNLTADTVETVTVTGGVWRCSVELTSVSLKLVTLRKDR
ncbi:MAG: hypothetical protein E7463_02360 [Ruminococcaceae bacterium]|nr:hypothetical protein [Oscillospiraceae bacterium]